MQLHCAGGAAGFQPERDSVAFGSVDVGSVPAVPGERAAIRSFSDSDE